VDALEEVAFPDGGVIIREGDEGQYFYIIVEGEVSITKAGQEGELARRKTGDYFGELSLKTGAPTIASVTAVGKSTKLVRMDRGAFQRLLGPLDSLLALRKYTAGGQEVEDEPQEGGDAAAAASVAAVEHMFKKAEGPLSLSDFEARRDREDLSERISPRGSLRDRGSDLISARWTDDGGHF
jgi:hypothetical protein